MSIERRKFLIATAGSVSAIILAYYMVREKRSDIPTEEAILSRIRELDFPPGGEVGTTFFPRKIMWELTRESEWSNNPEVIDDAVKLLAENGIKRMRLVVVPFELTHDGEKYSWSAIDNMLEMFSQHGVACDLCAGPMDYPYGPAGVRLPKKYEEMIDKDIHISMDYHPIRDWALDFTDKIFERYGNNGLIDRFYIGNEWPDRHAIEGTNYAMTIGKDFMLEVISRASKRTNKKLVLNSNIHPSMTRRLDTEFGLILKLLGSQGVLGLDTYPTQEEKDLRLSLANQDYGLLVQRVQDLFPDTEIEFTEMQAEPWPDDVEGKPWDEILTKHFDRVVDSYYRNNFPSSIETHLIPSGLKKHVFWGAPLWLVANKMGYKFPLQMISEISKAMA
jgi:hypothetical protein